MGLAPPAPQVLLLVAAVAGEEGAVAIGAAAAAPAPAASAQDVSMALWAVAAAVSSPSPPQLRLTDLAPLLALSARLLDDAGPQALSNTAWALGTISTAATVEADAAGPGGGEWPPGGWLAAFEEGAARSLGSQTDLGVYNLLWGLAKLRRSPSPTFLHAAAAAAAVRAPGASPQAASGTLWALASLRAAPGPAFWGAWHAATRAAVASSWGPADLANALWAHAAMGTAPPGDWLGAALGRALAVMPACRETELATLLWACAKLRAQPARAWLDAWMASYSRRALDAPIAPTLPCAAYSLALLRFRPPHAWAGRLVAEAARQIDGRAPF
ncbi:hypothetical protein MNEG_11384 [Monoraphidium neglectum]|uniref:Tbc2 translation factor, chloroplastic n=1 Tax=Monoraphidium neglectum TaxID=145388 RepID=A0A0D2LYW3_9CHLO|nr:hypothetical protein MNEG_11384 [Monoraphidium neglectum]KIY96579.1 hypothetical protein MNEG_11384 [Monoraphidium neglectum]|eukprot:XP_013895599.1 hypothetical protein MNEG_11384 [Monoraphidium neglectum]